ncbi:TPA: hypothetical protein EYP66_09210 [Candidatus Poribacteria bacterium]|nr:hypothetical protein [Candidatus Poribacteria bacterium]
MRTPYHGKFEPFVLRSNVIFFHDWRYVHHGSTRWQTAEGESLGLWGTDMLPPLRWGGRDIPTGIRLKALPAQKSKPFISPDSAWEGVIGAPTVIHQDGCYRLWYEVVSPEEIASGRAGERNLLCYAESNDGINWQKPTLGLCEYEGIPENNIVYGGELASGAGYHGGSVFLDPSCPDDERYKAFHLGFISKDIFEEYKRKYPEELDPHSERQIERGNKASALFGAVSSDGIHWKSLEEPLVMQVSDTQNIAYYDEFLQRYVAYFRTWVMGRRSIGRAETDDYRRFPLPETIIWPDASVGPSDLWYANAKTVYPGANDYHLMFPKRWHVAEDRFYSHIATSPDGILWGFPPSSQVLSPGDRNSWDTGGVSVGCGMVELPGERVGVPFVGYRIPHKYPRRPPLGEIAWASWQKGRFIALEAEEQGEFRTMQVIFKGNTLHLNVHTNYVGEVFIEAVGVNGKPIKNRTFADCDPINGDFLDRVVTWHGESYINRNSDEPVSFRVRMSSAQLFSMSFD